MKLLIIRLKLSPMNVNRFIQSILSATMKEGEE